MYTGIPELPYTVQLVVGDWSDDGHGMTEKVVYKTNRSLAQIEAAHKKTVEKTGLDLQCICQEYEDSTIPEEWRELIAGWFFPGEADSEWRDEFMKTGNLEDGADDFADLYMKMAQEGDITLRYEKVQASHATIHIGGYGLFYH